MAEYRDPTPISPREPEYDKTKVSKEVANYSKQVREKIKGHDVREALARNSEIADIKAEDAVATSYDTKARQDDVENRFDDQIAGNTDIDEVIDARRPEGEEAYPTLRKRLDEEHQEVTTQLTENTAKLEGIPVVDSYQSSVDIGESIRANNRSENQFRVATFNVKTSIEYDNVFNVLTQQTMNKSGADFIGLQEIYNVGFFPFEEKFTNELFSTAHYYAAMENRGQGAKYGNGLASQYPNVAVGGGKFDMLDDEIEPRGYVRVVYSFGGDVVVFYNVHLSNETESETSNQINQLFNLINNDPVSKRILIGDINTEDMSLLSDFINSGYTVANQNEFMTYKTYPRAIDNVILSPSLTVTNKGMVESGEESDHNIFYVDFKL